MMSDTRYPITPKQRSGRVDVLKPRFTSLQYQLSALLPLGESVRTVLEVGPGIGYFRTIAELLGYSITTFDIDHENKPDLTGDFWDIDTSDQYDVVIGFEVIQHMPYDLSLQMLQQMRDLSKAYVILSVPVVRHSLSIRVQLPRMITRRRFGLAKFRQPFDLAWRWQWPVAADLPNVQSEQYSTTHHWEIGRQSYSKNDFVSDASLSGLELIREFTNPLHDYHQYFVFKVL